MENEITKLIDTLCDRELIVRFTLNKTLKLSTFKIGTMELQGEFGVSFRNIETAKKVEETEEKEKKTEESIEINIEELGKKDKEKEKKEKSEKVVVK